MGIQTTNCRIRLTVQTFMVFPTSCKRLFSSEGTMREAGTDGTLLLGLKGYRRPRLTQCVYVRSQS